MQKFSLRAATQSDLALTYAINEDAMRGYLEQTSVVWDADEQFEKHQRSFSAETHQIILVDGIEAGLVAIEDFPTYTWLVKIYLLQRYRRLGIGSDLLGRYTQQASADQKPLRLQVLRVNHSAQKLYFRHGFRIAHETADRLFLEYAQ